MNQPRTVDDIVRNVRETVTEEKLAQLDAVARKLVDAENDMTNFLRAIRSREGTMFYMNTSGVKANSATLSLDVRVHGRNCGQVIWKGDEDRTFKPKNLRGLFSGCGGEELGYGLPWADSRVAAYLKKAVEKAERDGCPVNEASVQAGMIRSLCHDREQWSDQVLVTYPATSRQTTRGVPYQFPVPVSARGGITAPTGRGAGYTDLMTRKGRGQGSRLRVMELKAPGARDEGTALDQAVAYCAALECLLERGEWFGQLLGYADPHPPLEATAVVVNSDATRQTLRTRLDRLAESRASFPRLKLSVLLYQWDTRDCEFREVDELVG